MTTALNCQKDQFDLPEGVTYINCAYQSPKLNSALAAADTEIRRLRHPWTFTTADFFDPAETLRGRFASLIEAEIDDVAIVPSVSYGLSTAANILGLGPDQNVVVLEEQFPSNVYPWQFKASQTGSETRFVARPDGRDWSVDVCDAIDANCAIAAIPAVHWTDGYRMDLGAISRKCRSVGAALVLDLSQSAGVVPFSVKDVEADFVAAASYKWLLGPLGLSFLYIHPRHQQATPIEHGWLERAGSEDFSRLAEYTDEFQPGSRRFDAGQRTNTALLAMANAALNQILEWQPERILQYLDGLTRRIVIRADERGLETTPADFRSSHLVGITLPDVNIEAVAAALRDADVHVSIRGPRIRLSPYLYNTPEDVDRLFEALDSFL